MLCPNSRIFQLLPMGGKEECELCFDVNSIQLMDEEEGRILEVIHSSREPIRYVEALVTRHIETQELSDMEDEMACRTIMVALRHFEVDTQLMLKLISMTISHFADPRESFVDRACFLATSLYKKDEFGARARRTFEKFKALLPRCVQQDNTVGGDPRGWKEVLNPEASSLSSYDCPAGCFYDDMRNPVFLQSALKILKSNSSIDQLRAVHFHFKNILDRTTPRTFGIYLDEVFTQLLDLSNSRIYDEQFRSLAHVISRDLSLFDRALKEFRTTSLDTMRTYLLYAFDMVHDLIGLEQKVSIHLKFAETMVNADVKMDEVSRTQAILFARRGMALLQDIEQSAPRGLE